MRTIDEVAIAIDACTFNSDYIYGDKEEREQLDAHGAVLRAFRAEIVDECKGVIGHRNTCGCDHCLLQRAALDALKEKP